jgi:hypothetical protein
MPAVSNRAPLPLRLLLVLCLLFALASPAAAAKKTDILVMGNGDRITGEIDRLERGRLYYKTDDMGTLQIEWDKIAALTATATFEIEDLQGRLYYGALIAASRRGALSIQGRADTTEVGLVSVVRVSRLGTTIWKRMDGSIDLGTSFTSSSTLFQLNFDAESSYERPGYGINLKLSGQYTRQDEVEDTRRSSLSLGFLRRRPNRWFYYAQTLFEKNPELGFELRSALAGGGGRYLVQHQRDDLLAAGGLSVNREQPLTGETTTNPELTASLQYDKFSYDFPKVDVQITLTAYEGLRDLGRTRFEFNASLKREVLKDFNLTLKGYESYDSKPPTEGSLKNDFGMSFALGWTY